jgi:type II secretory pathway pseudopilin PulG
MTFIEVLVAIVLLGTVVMAVLTALQTTVIATATERDHSRAGQWLESAAKAIEDAPFGNCDASSGTTQSAIDALDVYDTYVKAAPVPAGWSSGQISVEDLLDIDVWDGSAWVPYSLTAACFDDFELRIQRVRITVESPDGRILEILEVVKRG